MAAADLIAPRNQWAACGTDTRLADGKGPASAGSEAIVVVDEILREHIETLRMLQLSVAYISTNKASGMYASLALVLSELLATFGSLLTTELFVELSPGGVGVAMLTRARGRVSSEGRLRSAARLFTDASATREQRSPMATRLAWAPTTTPGGRGRGRGAMGALAPILPTAFRSASAVVNSASASFRGGPSEAARP